MTKAARVNRDLKVYFVAIGLPALFLALGGLRLLRSEGLRLRENDRLDLNDQAQAVAADLNRRLPEFVRGEVLALGCDPATSNYPSLLAESSPLLRGAVWSWSGRAGAMGLPRRLPAAPVAELPPVAAGAPGVTLFVEPLALLSRMPALLAACGADGVADGGSPRATIAEIRQRDGALLMPASLPPRGSVFGEASLAPFMPAWNVRLYRRGGDSAAAADAGRFAFVGLALVLLLFGILVAGGVLLLRAARRARQEALRQTDFVSNVSHELKTPLTAICLCADLAANGALPEERRRKALMTVGKEAQRLRRLVENVLDFSRLERGSRPFGRERVDLSASALAAVEEMAADGAPPAALVPGREDVVALADPDAVRQILLNLLSNAEKYAASGGPAEIGVERRDGGRVALTVADRGPGLDANGLAHAFDRFWRGDDSVTRETGGSGLGLPIARALARGMGGDLSAAARPGGGLVLTLTLPEA